MKNNWLKYKNLIKWNKIPIIEKQKTKNKYSWFPDGKLNIAYNCIKKNVETNPNKIALCLVNPNYKVNNLTYLELLSLVEKFSYFLKKKLKKNKNSIIFLGSATLESAVTMLACSQLGVRFSIVFDDLDIAAIEQRAKLIKCDLFITNKITLKFEKLQKILKKIKKKTKIIYLYSNKKRILKVKKKIQFCNLSKLKKNYNKYPAIKSTNSFFILFTSGSTGIPKGIMHSYGGYFLYSIFTAIKQFGLNKNSTMLCASDAAWINGHTYSLFSPLALGATSILFEKPRIILDELKFYSFLEKNKPTIIYLPVTLIRLMKSISKKKFKFKFIKTIGSMGEPLASDIAKWYSLKFFNKYKPVVNTYFQTETGGIIASPRFNQKKNCYGTVGNLCSNLIKIKKLSKEKKEFKILSPWPGMMMDVINGKAEWLNYFDENNSFNLFDLASINKKKQILIHGRTDDVLNLRGKRIGTAEIESIILKVNEVSEVCAISYKDELQGENYSLFFSAKLNTNIDKIIKKIENVLIKYFGTYALPKNIFKISELPKTKSGKILRRLIKKIIIEKNLKKIGDISTINNKKNLIEILKAVK